MAIRTPKAGELVKLLIVALVFLFLITQFINLSAIGSGNAGDIFQAPPSDFVQKTFVALIVGLAVWMTWTFTGVFTTGRLDKKRLITMVIMGVVLYFVYNNILVGSGFLDLPPIEFAAAQLQAIIGI